MKYADISVGLHEDLPNWPGTPGFSLMKFKSLEGGDECNNSRLNSDVHVGTHVDAPLHFIQGGKAIDQLPLDVLIGPTQVVHLPNVMAITAADLSALSLPGRTERLLMRTENSALWGGGEPAFQPDFVAITEDAASWIVQKGIRLVGIDYLSIQQYGDGPAVHRILLEAEVVIVEGLNLARIEPGEYELICLPVKIIGAEGAPARAVLRPLPGGAGW